MTPLASPPTNDPRPDRLSAAVVERAAQTGVIPIHQHLRDTFGKDFSHEHIATTVGVAITLADANPWEAAKAIQDMGWPMDLPLANLIGQVVRSLSVAHAVETGMWAVRNGFKFPAKCEDEIEYLDPAGGQRAGKVLSLDRPRACAIVEWMVNGGRTHAYYRVPAENVIANITQAKYGGFPDPTTLVKVEPTNKAAVLGQRT